jgi:hypothetical protein
MRTNQLSAIALLFISSFIVFGQNTKDKDKDKDKGKSVPTSKSKDEFDKLKDEQVEKATPDKVRTKVPVYVPSYGYVTPIKKDQDEVRKVSIKFDSDGVSFQANVARSFNNNEIEIVLKDLCEITRKYNGLKNKSMTMSIELNSGEKLSSLSSLLDDYERGLGAWNPGTPKINITYNLEH